MIKCSLWGFSANFIWESNSWNLLHKSQKWNQQCFYDNTSWNGIKRLRLPVFKLQSLVYTELWRKLYIDWSCQSSGSSVSDIKTCNQTINQKRPVTIVEYEYMHNIMLYSLYYSIVCIVSCFIRCFYKHNYNYSPCYGIKARPILHNQNREHRCDLLIY